MKINTLSFVAAFSLLIAGCWTVSETEFPDAEVTRLPAGKKASVSLSGFSVNLRRYVPIEGHEQMKTNSGDCVDGPCVRANSATNVFYATRNAVSSKLLDRAAVALERKGFEVKTMGPQYVVDMDFEGPFARDYDTLKWLGLSICTLFTVDKNAVTWTGRMRVFDRAAKKQLFEKHYTNACEVTVWGPIPVASPACHPRITCTACSSWALTALADEAVADASKFIADRAK